MYSQFQIHGEGCVRKGNQTCGSLGNISVPDQEVTVGTLIGKGRDLANMKAIRTVAILCVQEICVKVLLVKTTSDLFIKVWC